MLAANLLLSFRSTVTDQISDLGDFNSGLIPPMAKLAPTTPPCAFRPPPDCGVGPVPGPKVGKVNPKGGLLLFPKTKIGAWADAVPPATNVGATSPGGLPRNSSCTFAWVSQLLYIPKPPRTTQSPLPVGSQATPMRGLNRLLTECSSALCVALA